MITFSLVVQSESSLDRNETTVLAIGDYKFQAPRVFLDKPNQTVSASFMNDGQTVVVSRPFVYGTTYDVRVELTETSLSIETDGVPTQCILR